MNKNKNKKKYISKDIGICVLTFNRPLHLKKTLNGLKKNNVKKLYIFCDGINHHMGDEIKNRNKEVIKIIKKINWCKIILYKNSKNLGLKNNWLLAKKTMFSKYTKVIFFEDDCVPLNNSINFMTKCLNRYAKEKKIKCITGFSYPNLDYSNKYDIFFSQRHCPWGFATWKRCWKEFKKTKFKHLNIINNPKKKKNLLRYGNDLLPMIINDYFKMSNSIGIMWSWYNLKNKGLCIYPKKTLINNIGNDFSGTHATRTNKYYSSVKNFNPKKFPRKIELDKKFNSHIVNFDKVKSLTYFIYSNTPIFLLKIIVKSYFNLKKIFLKNS